MREDILVNEFLFDIRKALSDSLHIKQDGLNDEIIEKNVENVEKVERVVVERAEKFARTLRNLPLYEGVTRIIITFVMLLVFVGLNWFIIQNINHAVDFDIEAIKTKLYGPEQRLITEKVYISLITGVVVQASAVFFTIVKFLFRHNASGQDQSGTQE